MNLSGDVETRIEFIEEAEAAELSQNNQRRGIGGDCHTPILRTLNRQKKGLATRELKFSAFLTVGFCRWEKPTLAYNERMLSYLVGVDCRSRAG